MLKSFLLLNLILLTIISQVFAKSVEVEALAKKSDLTKDLSATDLLTLNAARQIVTSELETGKLDSKMFWEKIEQKKLSAGDELQLLRTVFDNISVNLLAPSDAEAALKDEKLTGIFKAELNDVKFKDLYFEISSNLGDTKFKTFYILANIDVDSGLSWEDIGVSKKESFAGVVVESWKKLLEKDFKGFEKISVLDRDFPKKPDTMNAQSVTLKWTSVIKRTSVNIPKNSASFLVTAQYILVSTKSNEVLAAFDFPVQKREFDTQNKKALSSSLASLVYNLFLSQSSKISTLLESVSRQGEMSNLEIGIKGKSTLTEIFAINSILQEHFKDIKLTSQMKSFSSDGSTLLIRAEGSIDKILDRLSLEGGKLPLNEQKLLLFNRQDKSFAILPKDSNN
jgi:hypothetical protein